MSPRVSVVIPTRNRWRLLSMTLASVLAQQAVDLEVLVIDDASDQQEEPAGGASDARVKILRHERPKGVAAARNTGLGEAQHPWVAFIDDDDLWAPGKLAAQAAAMEAQSAAGWSCAGALVVNDQLLVIGYERTPPPGDIAAAVLTTNVIPGGGSSVLAVSDLVRDVGGFDEKLRTIADYDLWIRLAVAAPVAPVDRPLVARRVHAGAMSLDLSHIYDEKAHLDTKYASLRTERGIEAGRQIHFWIGDRYERAGRPVVAARSYLRARASVGWKQVLRRVITVPIPGAVALRDRVRGARVPPEWASADFSWLDELRSKETTDG
jgi:glycosyltransferase involved in cell wall biosynthesis